MNNSRSEHLERAHLVSGKVIAAKGQSHLDECDYCSSLRSLLKYFNTPGAKQLSLTPRITREAAYDIGANQKPRQVRSRFHQLAAKMEFDSWALPAVSGVRTSSVIPARQMRFETDGATVDLRAERIGERWSFVAEVKSQVSEQEFVVFTGKKKIAPNSLGMFEWESLRPPKQLTFKSDLLEITIPDISWQRTH